MDKALFVQNVKEACKRKGVKPTVACYSSGVGRSFINNIEARGQVPSVEKVQMLASYLGVTTSELLGEEKGPAPVSKGEPAYPSEYDLLSSEDKTLVDNMIRSLAKKQQLQSTKLYVAARDGSRIEVDVDGEIILPEDDSEIPE